jgi:hypothetical protein
MGLVLDLAAVAERTKQIEEEEAVALSFKADIINQFTGQANHYFSDKNKLLQFTFFSVNGKK